MEWYHCFMSQHPDVSLRMPEATSSAHVQGFNPVAVGRIFICWRLQEKFHFTPDRISNCDEAGITTVPNKLQKLFQS